MLLDRNQGLHVKYIFVFIYRIYSFYVKPQYLYVYVMYCNI